MDDLNLLTPESDREHRDSGLHLLTPEDKQRLKRHNDDYRAKFGFTFVVCARENKAGAILSGLNIRLNNTIEKEIEIGINEVKKIAKLRVIDILNNYSKLSKL